MVQVTVGTNRYSVPSSKELTTELYQKIYAEWGEELGKHFSERDYVKLFCILTGCPPFKPTPESNIAIFYAIKDVLTMDYPKDLPKEFLGRKVTEDIKDLTIGQNLVVRQKLESYKFREEGIAFATAVYLAGIPFKLEKALEIEKELLQMKAHEVYPIGFFLCSRALMYGQNTQTVWYRLLDNLKRRLSRMSQTLQNKNLWPRITTFY